MKVSIFLLCHNEELLIKHTLSHYRKCLSSVEFTIYDNYSSDNSADVAKELGCNVIFFDTNGKLNEYILTHLKNNCWKNVKDGFIIVCDMDEWLCVTDQDLQNENDKGTIILKTKGYNIICDSKFEDLQDVNLHTESRGIHHSPESKNICFKAGAINEMNFENGAHKCNPRSNQKIKFSEKIYLLKHMDALGLPYKLRKNRMRYERATEMAKKGMAVHYVNDDNVIINKFHISLTMAKDISNVYPNEFKIL